MARRKEHTVDLNNLDRKAINKLWKSNQVKELRKKRTELKRRIGLQLQWGGLNFLGLVLNAFLAILLLMKLGFGVPVFIIPVVVVSIIMFIVSCSCCDYDACADEEWLGVVKSIGLTTLIGAVTYNWIKFREYKENKLFKIQEQAEIEKTQSINNFVYGELESKQTGLLDLIRNQMTKQREAKEKLERIEYSLRAKKADSTRVGLVHKLIEKLDLQYSQLQEQRKTCLNALGDIQGFIQNTNETLEEEMALRTIQESYKLVEDSELMIFDNEIHIHKLLEMRNSVLGQFEATKEALKLTERAQLELVSI